MKHTHFAFLKNLPLVGLLEVQSLWTKPLCVLVAAVSLASCGSGGGGSGGGGGQNQDPVTVDLPIAYVERPIPVDEDGNPVFPDIMDPTAFNPGARIMVKPRATALAQAVDITADIFKDDPNYDPLDPKKGYDVKDLAVSADGTKLLFSAHAPKAKGDIQPKWHIYEYDITTKAKPRPIITSTIVAEQGDDLGGRYLPDGRILFASTRQTRSKAVLLDDGKPQFSALEEGGDKAAFVLHVMNDDGSGIEQITYNQSHDIQPAVLQNGRVLYTHWDQNGHDNLSFYTVNPDGTQVERQYGFFSMNQQPAMNQPTVHLFRPQEMQDGRIVAIMKPDGALLGGDMVVVDAQHFFENTLQTPAGGGTTATGQNPISNLEININVGPTEFSPHGRYSSLTPLYDGTNRLLVSWSQCRLIEPVDKKLVPCTDVWLKTAGVIEAPDLYGIWIYNVADQSQQPVVLGVEGKMFTEPVSLEARGAASYYQSNLDPDLAKESVGLLHIRSVYDMDGAFNGYGSTFTSISQIAQAAPDMRPARFVRLVKAVSIPDDDTVDALADTTYAQLYNRLNGLHEILGYAPVEPDGSVKVKVPSDVAFTIEILDKDGKRIGATHNNWLQMRPGETRQCNGCHVATNVTSGHGRSDAELPPLNAGAATAAQFPNTIRTDNLGTPITPNMGETMAEFASRSTYCLIPTDLTTCAPFSNKGKGTNYRSPSVDLVFNDEWTDPAVRAKSPSFAYRYRDLAPTLADVHSPTSEACMEDDGWSSLCRVTINYEQHIQPRWERPRPVLDGANQVVGDNGCITCHSNSVTDKDGNTMAQVPAGQLDLLRTKPAANMEMLSYTHLLQGSNKVILDANGNPTELIPVCELAPADLYPDIPACTIVLDGNGVPTCAGVTDCPFEQDAVTNAVLLDATGNPIPRTETITVNSRMSRGGARASARFFNKFTTFAAGDTIDHRGFLTDGEIKLLAEWLDLSARYYNNPFDSVEK